ncbi:hypothetical protein Dimus_018199 [Dionaea muscipula]
MTKWVMKVYRGQIENSHLRRRGFAACVYELQGERNRRRFDVNNEAKLSVNSSGPANGEVEMMSKKKRGCGSYSPTKKAKVLVQNRFNLLGTLNEGNGHGLERLLSVPACANDSASMKASGIDSQEGSMDGLNIHVKEGAETSVSKLVAAEYKTGHANGVLCPSGIRKKQRSAARGDEQRTGARKMTVAVNSKT